MRKVASGLALAVLMSLPAVAALKTGDSAPDFTTQATLGGNVFSFNLAAALQKGPVVLYFYPAAFTEGCTFEAHAFAEAMDKFTALGATVIGVSHDDIEKLIRFSVSECRGKFPVASDGDQKIMTAYDAILAQQPEYANRTSYVISPDGKIIYEYTDLNWEHHVKNTMAAVQKWRDAHTVAAASAFAADAAPAELETKRTAFSAAIAKHDVNAVAAITQFPLAFIGYEHPDQVMAAEFADEFDGLFFGGSPSIVSCLATGKLEPARSNFPNSPWMIGCDGNDYYFGERNGKWMFTAYENTNE